MRTSHDIDRIALSAAAPSALNAQPWGFVVSAKRRTGYRFGEAAFGQSQLARAPNHLVQRHGGRGRTDPRSEEFRPPLHRSRHSVPRFRSSFEDKAVEEREAWGNAHAHIALGCLLLLAESMKNGTSAMRGFEASKVKRLFGMATHLQVTALVAIGFAAGQGYVSHCLAVDSLLAVR